MIQPQQCWANQLLRLASPENVLNVCRPVSGSPLVTVLADRINTQIQCDNYFLGRNELTDSPTKNSEEMFTQY